MTDWRNPGSNQAMQSDIQQAIGLNTADNDFDSSSVASNADGSVLERLEYLQAQQAILDSTNVTTAVYNPLLGFGVTKASNLADGSGTDNLFTVTGRCLITSLTGEVTTVLATSTTMKLQINSIDICAATTITDDAVGTMYSIPGLSAQILNGTGDTPVIGVIRNWTTPSSNAALIVGGAQAAYTITHVLDGAGTGVVTWRLFYFPLVSGSTITAAA